MLGDEPCTDGVNDNRINGVNGEGNPYLVVTTTPTTTQTVDDNGTAIVTTNYDINVEAGEGLKRAENLAKTAVQTVKVGAISEDTAVSINEIGILKDSLDLFQKLINDKVLVKTKDDKYYVNK